MQYCGQIETWEIPNRFFHKNQILMYFCRLNTDAINPLLKEAYNVNTKLNNEGIHTWYTVALKNL